MSEDTTTTPLNPRPARITPYHEKPAETEEPSVVIDGRKIEIQGKTFFVDLIKNRYGTGLRISEKTANKRNRIVIPQEHFQDVAGCIMDMMAVATSPPKATA